MIFKKKDEIFDLYEMNFDIESEVDEDEGIEDEFIKSFKCNAYTDEKYLRNSITNEILFDCLIEVGKEFYDFVNKEYDNFKIKYNKIFYKIRKVNDIKDPFGKVYNYKLELKQFDNSQNEY